MPCVLAAYKKYIAVGNCAGKTKFVGKFDTKKKAQGAVKASKCNCKKQTFSGP